MPHTDQSLCSTTALLVLHVLQVYHRDAAAATLGASLSSLVSGLSISAPFLCEASALTVSPHLALKSFVLLVSCATLGV